MSDDLAGFIGDIPGWLPRSTQKAIRAEAAREYREARDAELEREQRAEVKRSAALALYAEQAEQRGEHVSAFQLATGQVPGRSAAEVLAAAAAMADREDAREAWRERREGGERLNFCFNSPPAVRAESPEGREIVTWYGTTRASIRTLTSSTGRSSRRRPGRRSAGTGPSYERRRRAASVRRGAEPAGPVPV